MGQYFDEREVRPAERRELDLLASLPGIVAHAKSAPYFATLLAHVDAESIRSRGALAQLPVTRKSDLKEHQSRQLPFGGMNATPVHNLAHLYMSPGPIFDLDGRSPDWWRFARPFHAAGLRAGDIIQNCFAYHFTPAAFMVDMAAQKLGCPVIPAGTGNTEMQVQAMRALSPSAYVGTPSFLKIIVEKAREAGARAIPFQRAVVSGEALPASLREWFRDQGIGVVTQIYASADLGNIAYETQTDGVVHAGLVIDEDICVEIVRPGTGDPVEPGEVGEVVVTTLNPDYPLIRFATGDLSAIEPGRSPCGRTNQRLRGWLGRADQTTKVRGLFVHPGQVAESVKRYPMVGRARLVVSGSVGEDVMTLYCELESSLARPEAETLSDALVATLRDLTQLRASVVLVPIGSLANDGKVISDERHHT